MTRRAIIGADVFDGRNLQSGTSVLLNGDQIEGVVSERAVPPDIDVIYTDGGIVMPGFVDLQVNGGGGVLFNEDPCLKTLITMSEAHKQTGTRAFLPTLITDAPEQTEAAIEATIAAIAAGIDGIVGLHLEGPHLSLAKKGAHDASLIRPMCDDDLELLRDAAQRLPNLLVTVAPESVSIEQIAQLSEAGVLVSLGHTNCNTDTAKSAFAAGAKCVTHLFNAMSQLGSREPGLVGAAFSHDAVNAGLIADGIHVHPDSLRIALNVMSPQRVFLVTDGMATVGSDITEFTLNGRRVLREDGRLTLEDGTLAGADLTMSRAIEVLVKDVGVPLEDALRMATSVPASILHNAKECGYLAPGTAWRGIHLGADFLVTDPLDL